MNKLLILAVASLASVAATQDDTNPFTGSTGNAVHDNWYRAVDMLRVQRMQERRARARLLYLERALAHVKGVRKHRDIPSKDRKAWKAIAPFLQGQIKAVKAYLAKDCPAFVKKVERYLGGLSSDKEAKAWEKARLSAWKSAGENLIELVASPPGPLLKGQELFLQVVGAPEGATFEWDSNAGDVVPLEPEPDQTDPSEHLGKAIWKPLTKVDGELSVRVIHDDQLYPVMLRKELDIRGNYTDVDLELYAPYRQALSELVSMEGGMAYQRARLEEVITRLEKLAEGDESRLRLEEEEEALTTTIENRTRWVEFLHVFRLPYLADTGNSDFGPGWEEQRQTLAARMPAGGLSFPWHIESVKSPQPDELRFQLTGLPPETQVQWTIGNAGEEDWRTVQVPGEYVRIPKSRSRDESLRAFVKPRFLSLPIQLDWALPASE